MAVSALAYVPLALIYSPWKWTHFGAFDFQMSRPLHYLVYFLAGLGIGAYGLDRGLLSTEGGLGAALGRLARGRAGLVPGLDGLHDR